MKLYIDKGFNRKINIDYLEKHYKTSREVSNEFYSNEGIFLHENNQFYKLTPVDKTIEKIEMNREINILIDPSYYVKKEVDRLSINHINIQIYKYIFHLNSINAIVECKKTHNTYTPYDIYFIPRGKSTSDLPMKAICKDIHEFISSLSNI